jgi:putative membrane protein
MKRIIRLTAAAALLFAVQQASAQGAPAGSASTTADPNAGPTFQQVNEMNAKLMQIGKLAAERGTTSNVKEYGQRIASVHQQLDQELRAIATHRGIQLPPAEQITANPAHQQSWQPIQAKSGLEFDKAIMDALVAEREAGSEQLKQLRDRTPGSDSQLKKWLDEMQDELEKTRNEARNVRQAVVQQEQQQQRQGRKP